MYMLDNLYGDSIQVEMSEICYMEAGLDEGMTSALWLSEVMYKDFVYMDSKAWCWWMATSCDDYNDGIVSWMWGSEDGEVNPTKRYFVMGNYSKFLSAGDKRIEGCVDNASDGVFASVFRRSDGSIIVVLTNTGSENITLNLPEGYVGKEAWETSENRNLERVNQSDFAGSYVAAPGSVTTIVLAKQNA